MKNKLPAVALGIILCALLVAPWGAWASSPKGVESSPTLLETTVELVGLPPITARRAALPLHWIIAGGTTVESTGVFWDTSSRSHDNSYRYRTPAQRGAPGHFFDYLDVPDLPGLSGIYLKPYAVVDGNMVYGDREYVVYTRWAINAGSDDAFIDSAGEGWAADVDYSHHWIGFENGLKRTVGIPIAGTPDPLLYQSQRYNMSSFRCWLNTGVAAMTVEVEFHFAEFEATAQGQRVFDIYMEGQKVIENLDVYALVGRYRALVLTRSVTVEDYELNISFVSRSGAPIINAILVRGITAIPNRHVETTIAFGYDDTYVDDAGGHLDAPQLLLGGNRQYHVGLRFMALQVPQGAVINHAVLEVTAAEDAYVNTKIVIYGHAVDDSPDFRSQGIITQRTRTTNSVVWNLPRTTWRAGTPYSSPELRSVIQEIVNRQGWNFKNSLTLLLIAEEGSPSAPRKIWAHEGSYPQRARLILDYTPLESFPPTPAPTFTFTPTATATATPTSTPTFTPSPTATPTPWAWYLPLVLKPFLKEE